MLDFPLIDDDLKLFGNFDRIISVDSTEEKIRTPPNVCLIFFRPSDPAVVFVGFLVHGLASSMARLRSLS